MEKETFGICGKIPGDLGVIAQDIFGLIQLGGGLVGGRIILFQVIQCQMSPFSVVVNVCPAGAGAGAVYIDGFAVDNGADHIRVTAVIAPQIQEIGANINNVIAAVGRRTLTGQTTVAGIYIGGVAGVILIAAGGAGIVSFVGMRGVVSLDIGVGLVAAFVSRYAEVIILGAAAVGHDVQTFHIRGLGLVRVVDIGVGFHGVEIVAIDIVNEADMREVFGKEQIAGQGSVFGAVLIGNVKIAFTGIGNGASRQNVGTHICLRGAPGDKGGAPGLIGHTVPGTVGGFVVGTFGVTNLGQCDVQDIFTLVAGVDICIGKFIGLSGQGYDGRQKTANQCAYRQE